MWHGHRLFSVDGSTVTFPEVPQLAENFGREKDDNPRSPIKGRISQLYDVLNELIYDSTLAPYRSSEKSAAIEHSAHLKADDLVLYDRGYPSRQFIALHTMQKVQFCFRMRTNSWKIVKNFLQTGKTEQIVDLNKDKKMRKYLKEYGIENCTVKTRLLRIDIGGEEPEVLMTSLLDTGKYPYSVFKDLYHLRWGVESCYRRLKESCAVQAFSAKSVEGVKQDFFGTMFSMSLTALLGKGIEEKINTRNSNHKHSYKMNWNNALAKFRNYSIILFFRRNTKKLLNDFIRLLGLKPCPVRPGRKFKREPKKRKVESRMNYKTT